ncbi:hypothetical protein GmHk_03G008579 [Glycine max]|nr:hypothetical protein GmHk_03G008579 [Glycine max]
MLYKRYNIIDRIKCDTTTLTVIQHEESCDPHEQKKWSMHMLARLALYMFTLQVLLPPLETQRAQHSQNMKPHVSGESSNLAKESSRSVGEKLHQVCKAAMVAIITDGSNQPSSSSRLLTNQRLSLQSEDPIRTLMFLVSWSHT